MPVLRHPIRLDEYIEPRQAGMPAPPKILQLRQHPRLNFPVLLPYNPIMPAPLEKRFNLSDLRAARVSGAKVPFLTCYDYTTARLMQEAGVPALLVGDSAANVILGFDTTLPVPLHFMIQITAAVRRGAPNALVIADMPFGSYQGSAARAMRTGVRMGQL